MIEECSLYFRQDITPPVDLIECTFDNEVHHSKQQNPLMPTVKIGPLMVETIPIFQSDSLQF